MHFFGLGLKKNHRDRLPKKTSTQNKNRRPTQGPTAQPGPLKTVRQFLKTTQPKKNKEKLEIKNKMTHFPMTLDDLPGMKKNFCKKKKLWFFHPKKQPPGWVGKKNIC